MHLMVSLRGKEMNVRLRKMVRHTRDQHRIPINIREFVLVVPIPMTLFIIIITQRITPVNYLLYS